MNDLSEFSKNDGKLSPTALRKIFSMIFHHAPTISSLGAEASVDVRNYSGQKEIKKFVNSRD